MSSDKVLNNKKYLNDILEFAEIQKAIKTKTPIGTKITDIIAECEKQINILDDKLSSLPEIVRTFENDKEKYVFIGEVKAKFDLYSQKSDYKDSAFDRKIADLQETLKDLEVKNIENNKELFVKLLEEIIQGYIETTKDALENYGTYHPVFNYKDKKLQLRKPKTDYIENVGSSSNHMFLHLFLFLGLHEAIIRKKTLFVPSFLIMDQPSRPYYGDENNEKEQMTHSDTSKITTAFNLLNIFITKMKDELENDFQIIVFEHIPKEIWSGMDNIHLVEAFRDPNALIPKSYMQRDDEQI